MNAPVPADTATSADEFIEYACDLCGSREAAELPRCRDYTGGQPVHVCRRCGFVYVIKRRSAERIARVWSEEIFGSGYTAAIPAVLARLTYVAEFLKLHVPLAGRRLCEIGAGEGEFLTLIRRPEYGALPFGIEPSPENGHRLTERGIPFFTGTIEDYASASAAGGPFDLAAILWTLENCQDCRCMLRLAHELLTPGGHIVVATGSRLLVPFKKPLHTYLSRHPADTHAFRFSANTLRAILAVSGFATVQINRFLDHDILCVIARREEKDTRIEWSGDEYLEICNFFERWHVDTSIYFPDPLA